MESQPHADCSLDAFKQVFEGLCTPTALWAQLVELRKVYQEPRHLSRKKEITLKIKCLTLI